MNQEITQRNKGYETIFLEILTKVKLIAGSTELSPFFLSCKIG